MRQKGLHLLSMRDNNKHTRRIVRARDTSSQRDKTIANIMNHIVIKHKLTESTDAQGTQTEHTTKFIDEGRYQMSLTFDTIYHIAIVTYLTSTLTHAHAHTDASMRKTCA